MSKTRGDGGGRFEREWILTRPPDRNAFHYHQKVLLSCNLSWVPNHFHPARGRSPRNSRGNNSSSGKNFEFPLGGFDEPNQQGGQSTSRAWEPVAFVIQDRFISCGSISTSNPVCGENVISAIASGRALAVPDNTLASHAPQELPS